MEKLKHTAPPASPSCSSVEQDSNAASLEVLRTSHPGNSRHTGKVSSSAPPPVVLVTGHRVGTAEAPEPVAMETELEDEADELKGVSAAPTDGSPSLSSPPPLLPAPAKTSPCPLPPASSIAAAPPSSSRLPPHVPVISLGHSKPPLPPLTALHPIPILIHGDVHRSQQAALSLAGPAPSGWFGGPGGPPAAPPGQYLPAHAFLTR